MYLVLIETSGNQNYIFATNKLRENIGASELTYLSSTKWLIAAVAKIDGSSRLLDLWTKQGSKQLRDKLLNTELNPPIENTEFQVEIILAASGKALLLVKEREKARSIIRQVTLQALKEAPGLDISGVIHEFDWQQERSLILALRQIHHKFEANRAQIPSPAMRFLRLPVIEECASSGLPAATIEPHGDTISLSSQRKRSAAKSGFQRIEALLQEEYPQSNFASGLQVLDADLDWSEDTINDSDRSRGIEWLGVIHADGNGLGKIFINFPEHLAQIKPDYNNRDYVNRLREFSLALDVCTERAFLSALSVFQPSEGRILPIFPLILGGDDLTVICDGKLALPFTKCFLQEFEAETRQNEAIAPIAKVALKGDRLSACAGVAIVKPHFPFSVAYELAESLAKSAKQVKEIVVTERQVDRRVEHTPYPCSAIDFHIVYDSSGVELQQIRQRLQIDSGQTKLYCRPYVVTASNDLAAATGQDWVKAHHWNLLQQWIDILKAKDKEGKPNLPNSQIYRLREDLALGKQIADSSYRLIQKRYRDRGINVLEKAENSLFAIEPYNGGRSPVYMTGLLDAIEAADFLVG